MSTRHLCLCAVQIDRMFTIAVVQPDVVADDKMDLILEKVNIVDINIGRVCLLLCHCPIVGALSNDARLTSVWPVAYVGDAVHIEYDIVR